MAEVHVIGTLVGASEFNQTTLSCKYTIVAGDSWSLLEGNTSGQTHIDTPMVQNFL
jgi:B9 domain-containing protein 2